MTQCDRVLKYMERTGSITSLAAFIDIGVISLPRRISDLKQKGHKISAERITSQNRYGETVHYNRYVLEKEPKQ